MFASKRPNIHSITVKFRCSHTQLKKVCTQTPGTTTGTADNVTTRKHAKEEKESDVP